MAQAIDTLMAPSHDRCRAMQPRNLLFILSDQHNRKVLGCQGHPLVRTPHLDALAARGTRFTSAYCHSPICVPSRASLATGRYVHEIRHWDNATPYDGRIPSWAHRLRDAGHRTVSIGKLHYRCAEDDNGWSDEQIPLHVVEGVGDLMGSIRDELLPKPKIRESIEQAGGGESSYTRYDADITERAVRWLREASTGHERPWVLFVSLVAPHPPLTAPERFYGLYPHEAVPWPVQATEEDWPMHPAIADYRRAFRWHTGYPEATVRRAIAAYLGLVSYLDDNVGRLLAALDDSGLAASTRVVYTSDHGDNLGNHGLWNKNTMYEDAAGVPLILAGEGVPAGAVVDEPVTLLDAFPTVLEAVGCEPVAADRELPGQSWFSFARGTARSRPVLLSQYHASGSTTGTYLVRRGPYKYVHYVKYPPQLFDVVSDPHETRDLAGDPAHADILRECEAALRGVVDPEAIDRAAHADQAALLARHGGREAVIARGGFGASPVPGEKPEFVSLR
jgi:choline-sulfatase